MTWRTSGSNVKPLTGRGLRFVLLEEIRRNHSLTVAEMAAVLADRGYTLPGRPSKVISDALRWEVARGRVVRVRRGVYAYGAAPVTTARRVRLFAQRCNAWIVAVMRFETPQPTPPTQPYRWSCPWPAPSDPERPPWQDLGWLWTT